MRTLLYLIFCVGLVLKLLHLPFHTVLLLIVVASLLANDLVDLLQQRTDRPTALATLATTAWLFHLVAVLKLFPFRTVTLVVGGVLTLVALVVALRSAVGVRTPLVGMLLTMITVLLVMAVPQPARYHFTNLRFSLERATDAGSWDKYSFLLMHDGKGAAALSANDSARAAAERSGDTDLLDALNDHRDLLEQGSWQRYHAPRQRH